MQTAEQKRPRLLVVEDEPEIVRLYQLLFEKEMDVIVSFCGQEAIEIWSRSDFDLVIMDIRIPSLDGIAVTQSFREIEQKRGGRRTPIIAVTALRHIKDKEKAIMAGIDEFVAKPFSTTDLAQVVTKHLSAVR